jgi:hypothetical protein
MKGGQGNTRREEKQMRFREGMAALAGAAFVLSAPMALAQVKTTNQGITDTEIAVGTHQDLSGRLGRQRHENGHRGGQRRRRHQRPQDPVDHRGQRL